MDYPYPFSAIVGQDEMKRALMLAAVDPSIGGILVFGDRGTGKSTAVRALAGLLPPMMVAGDCRYNCDPSVKSLYCARCREQEQSGKLKPRKVAVPVIDLPLGATEDRVAGALDLGPQNELWVGLDGGGAARYFDKQWLAVDAAALGDDSVTAVYIAPAGDVWFATAAGVAHWTPEP